MRFPGVGYNSSSLYLLPLVSLVAALFVLDNSFLLVIFFCRQNSFVWVKLIFSKSNILRSYYIVQRLHCSSSVCEWGNCEPLEVS